jgi:hypothetical protein
MRKERAISRRLFLDAVGVGEGATRTQIKQRSGLSDSTFRRVLNWYRDAKVIRVVRWINLTHEITGERMAGQPIAVYGLNPGGWEDADKNPRICPRKVVAKYARNRRIVLRAKRLNREGKAPNMFDQLRYVA